jgi:predicted ArsR family transcriptional regulator
MSLATYPKESPTRQIVEHLQRNGPTTVKELEILLGVTTTAVRQHLNTLQGEGYIQREAVHAGVGRPAHAYAVTDKARELFACHCDDLALTLLQEVMLLEGPGKGAMLLDRVGDRLAQRYAGSVRAQGVERRVSEMAAALEQRGVLTDVSTADGAFGPGALVLSAYNCPYHELAQDNRDICAMDEKMLRSVLGANVSLSSCIMDGHNRCAFVVQPASNGGAAHSSPEPAPIHSIALHGWPSETLRAVSDSEWAASRAAEKTAKEGKKNKKKKKH